MSVNPSIRSSSSQTYCGAKQISGILAKRTVVVSRRASAASTPGAASAPAPANPIADSTRRRLSVIGIVNSFPPSRLQLAFDLVEEMPVGAVGDDLLRARFDEARFAEAKGVPPDRVFGVIFPPAVMILAQRLKGVVVSTSTTATDELSRSAPRLGGAEICRLEDSA